MSQHGGLSLPPGSDNSYITQLQIALQGFVLLEKDRAVNRALDNKASIAKKELKAQILKRQKPETIDETINTANSNENYV